MAKKLKAKICPKCNKRTLYTEKRNKNNSRHRCINSECNYTKTLRPYISKNKIESINRILNFLNACIENENISSVAELKFDKTKILTADNIDEFKFTYNANPEAYPESRSVVLFCSPKEVRFVALNDYNKKLKCNKEKITYLPPGDAYNKNDNNNKKIKKPKDIEYDFYNMSDEECENCFKSNKARDDYLNY